jgi:hypothetical protein
MMRQIFCSERRCISNLIRHQWDAAGLTSDPTVFLEILAERSARTGNSGFNIDFRIDFVDWRSDRPEFSCTMSSIRPRTIGPEVYLAVETRTLAPMRLDLMFGDSFGLKDFKPYIELVESAVGRLADSGHRADELQNSNQSDRQRWRACASLAASTRISKCALSRVFVFGGDICFLYFPREAKPVMRGQAITLADDDEQQMVAYMDGDELVCVDGWIRAGAMAE